MAKKLTADDNSLDGTGEVSGTPMLDKRALDVISPACSVQFDNAGSGVYYLGYSGPGVGTDAASWQIQRVTSSGGDVVVEYADGDSLFDNVYDDRAGLSYS